MKAALLTLLLLAAPGVAQTPAPPVATAPDPEVVRMGARYREAILDAHLAAMEAVSKASDAEAPYVLASIQVAARDAGRRAAGQPISAEMERRFGQSKATPAENAAAIRAFYRDLATGYRGGAN